MKKTFFSTFSPVSDLPRKRESLDRLWRESEERWRQDEKSRLKPVGLLGHDSKAARHLVTLCIPFLNLGRWPLWHHKRCEPEIEQVRGLNIFVVSTLTSIATVIIPMLVGALFGWKGLFVGFVLGIIARIILGSGNWGRFCVEEKDGYLLLNYDVPENCWLFRCIRDHVLVTHDPNVVIGKFCIVFRDRERFLFYFFLSRIKEEVVATVVDDKAA